MEKINVKIEKSPIPLMWIDSSIVIKLAKIYSGERVECEENRKLLFIKEKIFSLVHDGKIICPKADQYEEIEIGGRLEPECRRIQQQLSAGIKVMHRLGIQDQSISTFMKAYIDNAECVTLNYRDIFYGDPINELQKNLKSCFTVDVHLPKHTDMIESTKKSKSVIHEEWEKIRKEKIDLGITFEQQLELEYMAHLQAHLNLAKTHIEKVNFGNADLMSYLGASGMNYYLNAWVELAGSLDLQEFVAFFTSDIFKQIPIIDVRSKLLAKLVTSSRPIKSGDSMDTEHLASTIPFFDVVITDRAMKNIVKNLELDKQYNCKVLAMEDFEEIKKYLKNI